MITEITLVRKLVSGGIFVRNEDRCRYNLLVCSRGPLDLNRTANEDTGVGPVRPIRARPNKLNGLNRVEPNKAIQEFEPSLIRPNKEQAQIKTHCPTINILGFLGLGLGLENLRAKKFKFIIVFQSIFFSRRKSILLIVPSH